jgi:hypothetical protein
MPQQTAKNGNCKTCKYLRKHPKCGLHTMLLEGANYTDVSKRFKGEAGIPTTIRKHWEAQHMVSRQLLAAKEIKDRKRGLELMECQRKVWDDAQEAIDMALGRKPTPETANLGVFAQCIGPQVKIIEVLAKVDDKPQVTQINTTNNYDNLSKEDLRAAIAIAAKLEGSEEGAGEEKPD